jgi:geranylgeranyl diphosphate synthase type I
MTHPGLASLIGPMVSELDSALRRIVDGLRGSQDGLHAMISYAMGWTGSGAGPDTAGKHIRPLLCMLSAGAAGTDWHAALPPACAVELIHSFSLIHDDIQDESPLRRGRPAVWVQYGLPHAINTGDAVFALAFSAITGSNPSSSHVILRILADTCLRLTAGQYLDMTYTKTDGILLRQYQEMIGDKTAALIASSCRLGAVVAGAASETEEAFAGFGHALGMAFQVQDDYLGIWGNSGTTGKTSGSDLLNRKKSLPILYGIEQSAVFRALLTGDLAPEMLPRLVAELEACGAKAHTLRQVGEWTEKAFHSLHAASPQGDCGAALEELTASLLQRQK